MRAAVAALAFLSLANWGGDDANPIATYPGERNGDHTAHGGILVREGDCLYLRDDDNGLRHFLAFPEGVASWDEGVLVMDGFRFQEGHMVMFTGGEGWSASMPWAIPPDDTCDLTYVWRIGWVFDDGHRNGFASHGRPNSSATGLWTSFPR